MGIREQAMRDDLRREYRAGDLELLSAILRTEAEAGDAGGGMVGGEGKRPDMQARIGDGYPYGDKWNFGVEFSEDDVTVHGGVIYRAGVAYERVNQIGPSITGLADGDLVCLVIGSTVDVQVRTSMSDTDGDFVRVLFRASVSNGVADIDKWYGGGIELGAKGTF